MLLSRTADHLYWHARYVERAENTARMLGVNYETLLMPHAPQKALDLWRAMLGLSELEPLFVELYGEISTANVMRFMITDMRNPSSIVSCLWAARENARAVRGALTSEMFETVNAMWLESREWVNSDRAYTEALEYLEWVKNQSHLSRGVALGTMLKDESFNFLRLGTFIERADNTARLLDLKFFEYSEHDADERVIAQTNDYYHWASMLRSVSAFEVFRKTYHDVITPPLVAEMLIFRKEMPRSLAACMHDLLKNLKYVRNASSSETERLAGRMMADLDYGRIQDVLDGGIHAYLTDFLEKVYDLGNQISQDFLVPLNQSQAS
jgi:uncharacterized alpha-E superfamily protein